MKKKYLITAFEISLLISMSFAFSYILDESLSTLPSLPKQKDKNKSPSIIPSLYKILIKSVFSEKNLVSALESSDLQQGVFTCLKSKDSSLCQEYPASECAELCADSCIPTPRTEVAECQLGTCYDSFEGTCQARSTKAECENSNGQWFDDPFENIPQCDEGCCVLGDQTQFVSDRRCTRMSDSLGFEKDFRPQINTELACLALANQQEEGACIFESEFENTCSFTTKADCLTRSGEFHPNFLCSHPELNTICEKQQTTNCVESKQEVYWFDSCGNRENIYSTNKVKSWNNGKVLPKERSCSLGTANNPLVNQERCGNCNYLLGSTCGTPIPGQDERPAIGEFVCRDLSCIDKDGNKREYGESWCEYQGSIGTDEATSNLLRSTDTPGSRHFRKTCIDGEVQTEPCAPHRNEICVESQSPKQSGGSFSSAACRLNRWQQCANYNTEVVGKQGAELEEAKEKRNEQCNLNPDCFIKEISIDSNFQFDLCAPKYPPGFDLRENGGGAEQLCSLATQKCTVVYVKEITGWKCVANCNCEKAIFTEQLNDLCMSLGDCGASVNFQGELSESYNVHRAPKLGSSYISKINRYSTPTKGQFAEPGNLTEFYASFTKEAFGAAGRPSDSTKGAVSTALATSGMIGVSLIAAAYFGVPIPGLTTGLASGETVLGFETTLFGQSPGGLPALQAAGGALVGAALGLAVTSILLKITGVGRGLDPAVVYTLLASGTLGGGVAGYALVTEGISISTTVGLIGLLGVILLLAVIITIVVFKLLGVGDTKKRIVSFECQPWQAPLGGADCEKCGSDGLPCSRYACQSLGQTCEFINEGTGNELCIDIAPNDASAPIITPNPNALQKGFSYTAQTERGVKIRAPNECIKAYEVLTFGINLNEPGQCKLDTEHTSSFEEMEFDFGGRSLFLYNHTHLFSTPSLASLGLPGYDPNRRTDFDLFVRCRDRSGNENIQEYVINFCIRPGDDLTAPIINTHLPQQEFIKFNTTNQAVSIFTNEPADCKYSSRDLDYDQMENSLACANDIEDQELLGWRCDATLPINKDENTFYVRCKDQPWEADDSKRNKNSQSYPLNLKRTPSELKIDSLSPDNETILSGSQPVSIELIAKTSGGVDGTAECSYAINADYLPLAGDKFADTWKTIHTQKLGTLFEGTHLLQVSCQDIAENTAEKLTEFEIKVDETSPRVTRIYNQQGTLVVITNEKAICAFVNEIPRTSADKCNFEFDNNTTIMSGEELYHSATFENDKTYYIKCKDQFGNSPGSQCSIIVKGSPA